MQYIFVVQQLSHNCVWMQAFSLKEICQHSHSSIWWQLQSFPQRLFRYCFNRDSTCVYSTNIYIHILVCQHKWDLFSLHTNKWDDVCTNSTHTYGCALFANITRVMLISHIFDRFFGNAKTGIFNHESWNLKFIKTQLNSRFECMPRYCKISFGFCKNSFYLLNFSCSFKLNN